MYNAYYSNSLLYRNIRVINENLLRTALDM